MDSSPAVRSMIGVVFIAIAVGSTPLGAQTRPASTDAQPTTRPESRVELWEPPLTYPPRILGDASSTLGFFQSIIISKTVMLRQRTSAEARPVRAIEASPADWERFIRDIVPAGTGVWIDAISFTIFGSKPEWKLEKLVLSTPNSDTRSPPPDFDANKLLAWLSLAQAVATESVPAEFVFKWRRTEGLVARFEALTENQAAASKLHERLSQLLKTATSPAKSGVFDGKTWWRVDVEGEEFAVSKPGLGDAGKDSHRISVKVTGEGSVIAEANEMVGSLDGVRAVVSTLGERMEKAFEKAIGDHRNYAVVVSIDVGAGLPLLWLEAAIFDLETHARVFEVRQDFFFETDVEMVLSVEGALKRGPVRPFKTIGLVRPDGAGLEQEVLLGLEVPGDPKARELPHVVLGKAGVEARDGWGRTWLSIGPGRATEPSATPMLSEMSPAPTARDVGAALTKVRQLEPAAISRAWRQSLSTSLIHEARGLEIWIPARGAYAGRRAHVVSTSGSSYIGMIEVASLPSPESPDRVACKVIAIDGDAGQRPFAAGQLVVFEPER